MAFEIFNSYGAAARNEATLRASGYLFLSKSMLQAIQADKEKFLVVLYDKEQFKMAVRAPESTDPEGARREVSIEKSGSAININSLLKAYAMDKPTKKAKLPVSIEQPMIVVDMEELKPIPF